MDSHSVSLALPQAPDAEWRVDVPMRAFQGGYYPHLIRLYTHLGVAFRKADFSFSFTSLLAPPKNTSVEFHPHFLYEGVSRKKGMSMPTSRQAKLGKQASAARHFIANIQAKMTYAGWLFVTFILWARFALLCAPLFRPKDVRDLTWAEWVERYSASGPLARWTGVSGAWNRFINDICLPMFSGTCSATYEDVWQHPAEEFLGE